MAICSLARSVFKCLLSAYRRVQVSHRGKYSIERLLALQEYSQSTSTLRVLLVCVLTPMPMLVIALGLESIPLQDPSAGWKADRGMWMRTALAIVFGTCTIGDQIRLLVPGVAVRWVHVIVMSAVVSVFYTVTTVEVAALWVFPIPFMIIVMNGPLLASLAASFFIVVGRRSIQRMLRLGMDRQMLVRYAWFLCAQAMLCLVYPVYSVMFVHLANAGYEVAALLVLPVVRVLMRNLMAYYSSHLEDPIPAAAIFTVELFNSLHLAASMQRVSSIYSVLVILVVDTVQVLFALHGLRSDVSSLAVSSVQSDVANYGVRLSPPNVLFGAVNCAAAASVALSATTERSFRIRLRSCVKHKLSMEATRQLAGMDQRGTFATSVFARERCKRITRVAKSRDLLSLMPSSQVVPIHDDDGVVGLPVIGKNALGEVKHPPQPPELRQRGLASPTDLLRQLDRSLQVAFTIEYTALSEYLESVMQVLYVVYVSLLMKLPSRAYHTELTRISDATLHRSINNTFLYGLMEILSFVLLAVLLRRSVQMNALYVVAFVLETHMTLVQGMLVTWMLIAQEFQVEHWDASSLCVVCVLVFSLGLTCSLSLHLSRNGLQLRVRMDEPHVTKH